MARLLLCRRPALLAGRRGRKEPITAPLHKYNPWAVDSKTGKRRGVQGAVNNATNTIPFAKFALTAFVAYRVFLMLKRKLFDNHNGNNNGDAQQQPSQQHVSGQRGTSGQQQQHEEEDDYGQPAASRTRVSYLRAQLLMFRR